MPSSPILLPVAVQMLFTLLLYSLLGRKRLAVLRSGEVRLADIAIESEAYPEPIRQMQNNLKNQFELPILFYVVSLLVYASGAVSGLELGLAVAFVLSRLIHSRIHVTSNHLVHRFRWFTVGWVLMIGYLLVVFVRLMVGDFL